MRYPSIKTLSAVFSDPKRAREILTMPSGALRALPVCARYLSACHGNPRNFVLRMLALDDIEESAYGVEAAETAAGMEWLEYLNVGDSYAPTVIYWRGNYRVQSVGDFLETSRVKFK